MVTVEKQEAQRHNVVKESSIMKWLLVAVVAVVYLIHQDYWLWHDKTLVFGFLPIGLAYHAGFSILCAGVMALLVKFAWPKELEESVPDNAGTAVEGGH